MTYISIIRIFANFLTIMSMDNECSTLLILFMFNMYTKKNLTLMECNRNVFISH